MFCDLAGFTGLSERIAPEKLVEFLNVYFSVATREIAATDGIIDKLIGDAVMADRFSPSVPQEEVALRSAEAAPALPRQDAWRSPGPAAAYSTARPSWAAPRCASASPAALASPAASAPRTARSTRSSAIR